MGEGIPKQFSSAEEELMYLRDRIAKREQELLLNNPETKASDTEIIGHQEIQEYASFTPRSILDEKHALKESVIDTAAETISSAPDPVKEILDIAFEKGIRNALSVLSKVKNAYVIDEVHRQLVEFINSGASLQDLKEGEAPWQILHMTLYEVTLPEMKAAGKEYQLSELIGMMEQLLAGLRTIGSERAQNHFVIEVAVADNSDDIVFYVAVPNQFKNLFEKQTLSLFPYAELSVQTHDYNVFVPEGATLMAEVVLKKPAIYPIKTHDGFTSDPLAVVLNAFSRIEREGGGAAIQFVLRHPQKNYRREFESVIKNVQKGMKAGEAISRSTISGQLLASVSDLFSSAQKNDDKDLNKQIDTESAEIFSRKIKSDIIEANIRIAVSAKSSERAEQILTEVESTFNQFDLAEGNSLIFKRAKGSNLLKLQKSFSFRDFSAGTTFPLSLTELSTLIHFPGNGLVASPQFKQSLSNTAAAPNDMPQTGTLLGINQHRNAERKIYITPEDRLRHFYIIGQTGAGKTTLMKNMIIQDIEQGNGVCMIDPHGTDIDDVLAAIPKGREEDVIYFDPSRLDRVLGLNMLEYDETKPEQKTFVVNELFSIFQKLYGANPESMGPMFEQYFRNATLLVMEDPDSGSTLMDISRVMSDPMYRRLKLERAKNPVVVQFWREIATKAGGEAALENIVPYIVSKFDVFTANDYMRPIIGQQKSAFNFRAIMDEKKILLVNLSKGRLGDINSNLIGMIFVGKILMAALSRVDDIQKSYPPFYLHMDEFQNISTNSISAILSEARKYKLGLTMAHQFIAQLDTGIKDSVFGNVGSIAAFRVGPDDAQFLEAQFSPVFSANDLMNVPNRKAFLRVLANGTPTKPFSINTLPPAEADSAKVLSLIERSYQKYGREREGIEAEIAARYVKKVKPEAALGVKM